MEAYARRPPARARGRGRVALQPEHPHRSGIRWSAGVRLRHCRPVFGSRGRAAIAGPIAAQTLDGWAAERGLARHHGRRLGEPETLGWLRGFAPNLLILAGADIIPATVLEIPSLGTINPHYGLLPRYRGMNVTEWSIYHDDPVGVTVHAVDSGIDTGDILLAEAVMVPVGATLASIREQQQETSARLLENAAMGVLGGEARPISQRLEDGKQFYRMHPLLRERVEKRLADGRYRWLGLEALVNVDAPARSRLRRTAEHLGGG